MKKINRVFIVGILILFVLTLTGCKNKIALKATDFETQMRNLDYIVQDATDQYTGTDGIVKIILATPQDKKFQIEFYEVETVNQAINSYNLNKTNFENSKSNSSSYSEVNLANYSKYVLNSNGKYMVVSRIENTFIFVNTDNDNKQVVNEILKKLGY